VVVSLVHRNAEHGSTGPHAGTDRCPGALEVHRADDGGLVRIRVPGGMLVAATLAELADWAEELGNGRVELTVRSNLQLRGIRAGAEHELAARLAAHGLLPSPAHDRARNVTASPLSGRDGVGTIDVRPLVGALDRALCATPGLAELPGRFLFALDDGRGDVAGMRADVCVIGLPGDRVALLLGGHDTGLRLPIGSAVPALIEAAAAFLRHRPDQRTWRIAELPGGPLSLLENLVRSVDAVRAEPLEVPVRDGRTPLGRIGQIDGLVALAVSVPLGELTAGRCRALAAAAHRCVVLMPGRGVLLPDLTPEVAAVAAHDLAATGLITDHGHPLLGVSACTGRPGCAKALADVRADAALVPTALVPAASVVTNSDRALAMHWSGCARRCGRPAGTVVDVVAELEGYQVFRDDQPVTAGADAASAHAAADRVRYAR
jgi:precorrin-3B synthase